MNDSLSQHLSRKDFTNLSDWAALPSSERKTSTHFERLWMHEWNTYDWSWEGLAQSNFLIGNRTSQNLKAWYAPDDWPGETKDGSVATLQEYWRPHNDFRNGAWDFDKFDKEKLLSSDLREEDWYDPTTGFATDEAMTIAGHLKTETDRLTHIAHLSDSDSEFENQEILKRILTRKASFGLLILNGGIFPKLNIDEYLLNSSSATNNGKLTVVGTMFKCKYWSTQEVILGSVRINSALFSGSTYFENAIVENALKIRDSVLNSASFKQTNFKGSVDFFNTNFKESMDVSRARFSGSVYFSNIRFEQTFWCENVEAAGDTEFENSVFSQSAYFGESNFEGTVTFTNISVTESAQFEGTRFASECHFRKCALESVANFESVKFLDTVSFSNVRFGNSANFQKSEFATLCEFTKIVFEEIARFESATFISVNFDDVTFCSRVNFYKSEFSSDCSFRECSFSDYAEFTFVKFASDVSFRGVTIAEASFSSALFGGTADFGNVKFQKYANFSSTSWNSRALFTGAFFGEDADFKQARFEEDFVLAGSVIQGDAKFDNALFQNNLDASDTQFDKGVSLKGTQSKGLLALEEAVFGDTVDLVGSSFQSGIEISIAKLRELIQASEASQDYARAEASFRKLKSTAKSDGDERKAQLLHAAELNARLRQSDDVSEIFAGWIYRKTSGYGEDILLPLMLGFVILPLTVSAILILVFEPSAIFNIVTQFREFGWWVLSRTAVLFGVDLPNVDFHYGNSTAALWLEALDISYTNQFRPFWIWSSRFVDSNTGSALAGLIINGESKWWSNSNAVFLLSKLFLSFHSIASAICLFLSGLALRRRFQIG